ncbi:endonuclease VIII [Mycoplasmatota bacterium]|nr:endonuclease VIII [Mycoplasmatota bacterium]
MIEIPEAIVLSEQINETLKGKIVKDVIANQSPHKFAWFYGDPSDYNDRLIGNTVIGSNAVAGFVEIRFSSAKLIFCDGIRMRYLLEDEKLPKKRQLLIKFEDNSVLVATVQMYGGLWCVENEFDNPYYLNAKKRPSPLSKDFDLKYFKDIVLNDKLQNKAVKPVLATEQRIPGLGNGVLQDILYRAKIHPKRKMNTLSEDSIELLYESIKSTLYEMVLKSGRNTEKDLFGDLGGYVTKLSKNTVTQPCEICGSPIQKKSYMGGSIYYCEKCQVE